MRREERAHALAGAGGAGRRVGRRHAGRRVARSRSRGRGSWAGGLLRRGSGAGGAGESGHPAWRCLADRPAPIDLRRLPGLRHGPEGPRRRACQRRHRISAIRHPARVRPDERNQAGAPGPVRRLVRRGGGERGRDLARIPMSSPGPCQAQAHQQQISENDSCQQCRYRPGQVAQNSV